MYEFFKNIIEKNEKTCICFAGNEADHATYRKYYDNVCECAERIRDHFPDISGKHVGLLAESSYEYIVVLGALFICKTVIVPINHYESAENIEYIIENADVDILIVADRYDKYDSKGRILLSELAGQWSEKHYAYNADVDACIDETTLILYTSGTTGKPKGVVHPLGNLFNIFEKNYILFTEFSLKVSSIYITVPMYHVMGLYYWLMSFRCGWKLYLNSVPGKILYELREIKPDLIIATPALIKIVDTLTQKESGSKADYPKFIISGGAVLDKGLVNRLWDKGIECINSYGMTETMGAGTCNFDVLGHSDSLGVPTSDTDIEIIDGEICIKCAAMMKGYYKDQSSTTECLIDGYMHTGDLGYIAEDGYVYITGRKKNLIILSGGENVSPEELESDLYKNPLIRECVIFEKNDRIVAEIYAPKASAEEIQSYVDSLNSRLPIFKRIHKIEIRDGVFEKTSNGKIKRSRSCSNG